MPLLPLPCFRLLKATTFCVFICLLLVGLDHGIAAAYSRLMMLFNRNRRYRTPLASDTNQQLEHTHSSKGAQPGLDSLPTIVKATRVLTAIIASWMPRTKREPQRRRSSSSTITPTIHTPRLEGVDMLAIAGPITAGPIIAGPMQKLAPELLAAIFDQFDDVADLCTVRILCGNFKEAAWPAFARSLNDRVFHLTPYSLKTLSDLANHKAVVPYVKRLQISTVKLHLDGDTSFSDWERTSGRWDWEPDLQRLANDTYDEVSEKDRKDMDRDEARALLKSLLQQLTVLTSLVIVDGGEYTRPIRLFKFPDRVNKRLDEIHRHRRLYDLHAHKDTLDLVAKALCSCKSKALCSTPCNRISKFKTVGSIDFADLSCSGLLSKLPLLKTTTLNLTMTPTTMQRLDGQRSGSLEELLEPIAPSLVSLTLTFPNYITSGSGHDTSDYIRPTLGLHFPRLHTIHIAYLQDQGAFNSFLKAHTSTLRTLRLKGYSTTQPRFDAFLDVLANHMRLTLFELRSGHTKQQALEVIASGRAWLQYDEKEIKRCADSVLLNTAGS